MTVAVNPARAAHLFISKTSGQLPARNIASGLAPSDLVHFVSRLFRTLRRFLVSLNLTNGSAHNIVPRRFERCGCRLKTKIKFPPEVCLLFGLPRKFGLTHGEVKPPFLVRPKFGLIRRASLRINYLIKFVTL